MLILGSFFLMVGTLLFAGEQIQHGFDVETLTKAFSQISQVITGDWRQLGLEFTRLQGQVFWKLYLAAITVVPGLFLLHYLIFGPKAFPHRGKVIAYYTLFVRLAHWLAAISFTLLVVTGFMVIFGRYLGGGHLVMGARLIHIPSAVVFVISAVILFPYWLKDMLPAGCDLRWFLILGGYLSRKKEPVPADKFNAGQKIWFWLATIGGLVMAYSGYYLFTFKADVNGLRWWAIVHNLLGIAIVTFFLIHLYMSVFVVKGSLKSMITGFKSEDEVAIMHSRYYQRLEK